MKIIDSQDILNIFNLLNQSDLNYILIRNTNNELPNNLEFGKDIDILIDYKDKHKFYTFFKNNNFEKIRHPHRDNIYLYGVHKFDFFRNKKGMIFDINYHLLCRSLDAGQWIPLDQTIQESAWENKRFEKVDDNFSYWTLSYNDEFIALVARSVFDKREFQSGYIKRIDELKSKIDIDDVKEKLELVFFKYTSYLLVQIEKGEYTTIIKNYIQFKDY